MPNCTAKCQSLREKLTIYEGTFPDKPTNCYALLLFEEGYAEISVNHTKYHCAAPSVLCLNDQQSFKISGGSSDGSSGIFLSGISQQQAHAGNDCEKPAGKAVRAV